MNKHEQLIVEAEKYLATIVDHEDVEPEILMAGFAEQIEAKALERVLGELRKIVEWTLETDYAPQMLINYIGKFEQEKTNAK